MHRLPKAVITALALFAAMAPPSYAVTFSAPATVVHSNQASRFAVAVNAGGEQAFAWEVTRELSPAPRFRQVTFIGARTRSAGGTLRRTERVRGGRGGIQPDVAIAPDGTAIVVWSGVVRGHFRIFAAVRRKGGRFGRSRQLGRTDKQLGALPQVELDRQGNAIVVWRWSDRLQWVFRARGHGFGSVRTVRVGRADLRVPIQEKQLAFDRQRNAHLVLASSGKARRASGGKIETVVPGGIFLSVRKRGAARFSPPRRVSPAGAAASKPRVAAGAAGEVLVAWRGSPTPTAEDLRGPIVAATVTNGRPGTPQTLTTPGQSAATDPVLSAAPQGEAAIVWVQFPPAGTAPASPDADQVAASTRLPGGSFGPSQVLSSPGVPAGNPFVAVTDRATAVALWQEQVSGSGVLVAAAMPRGGAFGSPTEVARPASNPAYGHAGNRVAALFSAGIPDSRVVTGVD